MNKLYWVHLFFLFIYYRISTVAISWKGESNTTQLLMLRGKRKKKRGGGVNGPIFWLYSRFLRPIYEPYINYNLWTIWILVKNSDFRESTLQILIQQNWTFKIRTSKVILMWMHLRKTTLKIKSCGGRGGTDNALPNFWPSSPQEKKKRCN